MDEGGDRVLSSVPILYSYTCFMLLASFTLSQFGEIQRLVEAKIPKILTCKGLVPMSSKTHFSTSDSGIAFAVTSQQCDIYIITSHR